MDELAGSETPSAEEETRAQVREGLADLRREVADLVRYESRLAVAAHRRSLMRRAVDVAGPLAVAFLLLTAFVLANAAAVYALSGVMASWAAALVLAGGWLVVAGVLALLIWIRGEHGHGVPWWRALAGGSDAELEDVRAARARTQTAIHETVERLAPAVPEEGVSAVAPIASEVAAGMAVEVAGDVVGAGEDLLEGSDEVVESLTANLPGGGIVNLVWDVVLLPGRAVVRTATIVLRRPTRGADGR